MVIAEPKLFEPVIEKRFLGGFDYGRPLGYLIDEGGYDQVNPEVWPADKFQVFDHRNSQEILLVCFRQIMNFDEVIEGLDNLGCRPAAFPELLALGTRFKDDQRRWLIPALDSIWHKNSKERLVPMLCMLELKGQQSRRHLTVYNCFRKFPSETRFAAVKL
jgi:hypothetical protein